MSPAGCEEASLHPVPPGLIHSGQLTALTPTATLSPRAQSTAAWTPWPQPRACPGWLLHGACPRGSRLSRPHAGRRGGPGPARPARALSPPAPALPASAQTVGEAAQERGQPGPARQQAQQPPPEHRARCRRRHGDPPLPLPARENFIDSASADRLPARRRGSDSQRMQTVLPGLASVSLLGHSVAPGRELEGGRHEL